MPVEQPSNIYREQITSLYHGLALWKPNPVEGIYNQVSIGDVGYISLEGVFIRMFNCYDPLTLASIVEHFGQVDYYSRHVSREDNAGNTHESYEQTEVTYTCRGPGALLSLPCGGHREDAIQRGMFRERIRDNVDSWFNWSRNADLPVDRMDDLILVTGCTLATSYASAVFDDHITDAQISLVSRPLNNGGANFVRSNNRGTIEYHDSQVNPNIPSAPRNRCVFIRGFRARRVLFWTKPFRAAAEPRLDDPDDPDDNRTEDIQVNEIPCAPKYLDPVNGVLDYIAEKCLEAANAESVLAIAHDDDLQIIDSRDLETLTADAVLKFLHESKVPVLIENDVATLQGNKHGLFSQTFADPEAQKNDGETPLHLASQKGQVNTARMLIDRGADLTARKDNGETPLHLALQRGHVDVARMLIERGADLTAQTDVGSTPLHLASQRGQVDIARLLIERGADLAAQTDVGSTPLHHALQRGHIGIARMLIERGADSTVQKNNGDTPLDLALKRGHVDVARMLIERGANLTPQTDVGSTLFHLASQREQVDVARKLIEHGADPAAQTDVGSTSLRSALEGGHMGVARMLIERDTDPTA